MFNNISEEQINNCYRNIYRALDKNNQTLGFIWALSKTDAKDTWNHFSPSETIHGIKSRIFKQLYKIEEVSITNAAIYQEAGKAMLKVKLFEIEPEFKKYNPKDILFNQSVSKVLSIIEDINN